MTQPLLGLTAQFRRLVALRARRITARPYRKSRQDRLAHQRTKRAALGNLNGRR